MLSPYQSPIHYTFSDYLFDGQKRTLTALDMTRVVPKVKFAEVAMQELFPYVVVYSVYARFENRRVALNCICAGKNIALFASVDVPGMANRATPCDRLRAANLHFASRSTSLMGRSKCASRISNRRCSSFLYVSWSG